MEVHGNWHLPRIEQNVSESKSENGSNAERHILTEETDVKPHENLLFYEKRARISVDTIKCEG
jgi:hypothetical protein